MIELIKKILSLFHWRHKLHNRFQFKLKKVSYADFPKINGSIFLRGTGKVYFGKGISINSSKSANAIGGDTRMVIRVYPNAILRIGDFTGMSNSTIICHQKVIIGSYVKIGGSVKIYDTDFHSLDYIERKEMETDTPNTKEIIIGDHSFIGAHSIILKGVQIGEKCIVGAGSVVTKSIPDGEIWGGNPAKFIKNSL